MRLITDSRLPFCGIPHAFIELNNCAVLQRYIAPQFSQHLSVAAAIVGRIYERVREIDTGFVYPADPEVMAHIMPFAKDEVVVELGGASGENGIAFAFAGAKHVYVNDIDKREMTTFRTLCSKLPQSVANTLEAVEGDCLDILKKKPELRGKVGLISCRNVIHFFTNAQQLQFIALLKEMLKPGGRAVFTANSVYQHPEFRATYEQFPNATSFECTACPVINYAQGEDPCAFLFSQITPCDDTLVSLTKYNKHFIYEKTFKNGGKWTANNQEFHKLSDSIRPKVSEALAANKKTLQSIPQGNISVVTTWVRAFNKDTLAAVFEQQGFEVETTFALQSRGHLNCNTDLYKGTRQIGIIVRLPENLVG